MSLPSSENLQTQLTNGEGTNRINRTVQPATDFNREPTKPLLWTDGSGSGYSLFGFIWDGVLRTEPVRTRPMLTPTWISYLLTILKLWQIFTNLFSLWEITMMRFLILKLICHRKLLSKWGLPWDFSSDFYNLMLFLFSSPLLRFLAISWLIRIS